MAVKIRLTRLGAPKKPTYRIVATDSRRPRSGQYLELIGTYFPVGDKGVKINEEVALKWLNRGAIPTDTVRNLLSKAGIMKKFADSKNKKAPKKDKKEFVKEEKPVAKKTTKKVTTKKATVKKAK
jgi:small subunit ribosomal protein S16